MKSLFAFWLRADWNENKIIDDVFASGQNAKSSLYGIYGDAFNVGYLRVVKPYIEELL